MIVVIPVCHKDDHLVAQNLRWLKSLAGTIDKRVVISVELGFDIGPVRELSEKVFSFVDVIRYQPWNKQDKWPGPQNWAWQSTARLMVEKYFEPWLWWEADAIPLSKFWIDKIEERHKQGKHPFSGAIVHSMGHMNGVAVWPHDAAHKCQNAMLTEAAGFDVVACRMDGIGVNDISDLIQHHLKTHGPKHFPDNAEVKKSIQSSAVLFHGCEDGSLIKCLESGRWRYKKGRKNSTAKPKHPKQEETKADHIEIDPGLANTVVLTNHERPDFLWYCWRSVADNGAGRVVVTSTGCNQEVLTVHRKIAKERPDVTILAHDEDPGCNRAWLNGVMAAKTSHVSLLHDDDIYTEHVHRIDKSLDSSAAFLHWTGRKHAHSKDPTPHMSEDHLAGLGEGLHSTSYLLPWLLDRRFLTFSPVSGCFPRTHLIETLLECERTFGPEMFLKPTMMVGNDLMIWLRAAQKFRTFRHLKCPVNSFGHHPGSISFDDQNNQRGRLQPIYNRVRDGVSEDFPTIWHLVSRYEPSDPDTKRRILRAEWSWRRLYQRGIVKPLHVWKTRRTSRTIGDYRSTPFLKDVLKEGLNAASKGDWIAFTNDDTILHPDLLAEILRRRETFSSFRVSHNRPPALSEPPQSGYFDKGRDLFVMSREWLAHWLPVIPDYVLGSTDWDSTLGNLIRLSKGYPLNRQNCFENDESVDAPLGLVYHEWHTQPWKEKEPKGNRHNRRLSYDWAREHGYGWYI